MVIPCILGFPKVQAEIDWEHQETYLIGWGSPFDPDDHTYKVFGTQKEMLLHNTDFPQPLSPTMAKVSPSNKRKERFLTACIT